MPRLKNIVNDKERKTQCVVTAVSAYAMANLV